MSRRQQPQAKDHSKAPTYAAGPVPGAESESGSDGVGGETDLVTVDRRRGSSSSFSFSSAASGRSRGTDPIGPETVRAHQGDNPQRGPDEEMGGSESRDRGGVGDRADPANAADEEKQPLRPQTDGGDVVAPGSAERPPPPRRATASFFSTGRAAAQAQVFVGAVSMRALFSTLVPLLLQLGNADFEAELSAEGVVVPDIGQGFALSPAAAFFLVSSYNLAATIMHPFIGKVRPRHRPVGRCLSDPQLSVVVVVVVVVVVGVVVFSVIRIRIALFAAVCMIDCCCGDFFPFFGTLMFGLFEPVAREIGNLTQRCRSCVLSRNRMPRGPRLAAESLSSSLASSRRWRSLFCCRSRFPCP